MQYTREEDEVGKGKDKRGLNVQIGRGVTGAGVEARGHCVCPGPASTTGQYRMRCARVSSARNGEDPRPRRDVGYCNWSIGSAGPVGGNVIDKTVTKVRRT